MKVDIGGLKLKGLEKTFSWELGISVQHASTPEDVEERDQ